MMAVEEKATLSPLVLHSVTIRRFRSFYDVGPVPLQGGLTVLTGENDGGKSTCLDAIDFLLGGYTLDDEDRCRDASEDEPVEVEGVFYGIDDPSRTTPLRVRVQQGCSASRTCEVLDLVHRAFKAKPASLKLDELRARMAGVSIEFPGGTARGPYQAAAEKWIASRPDDEFEECWRPMTKDEASRLPRLTRFASADAESPVSMIQRVVARETRRLVAEPAYASELTQIAVKLDQDIAPSLQYVKERIQQHCSDLDAIEIRATFDFSRTTPQVQLRLGRQGTDIDLRKAGQGRLRRVALAIHEANLRSMEEEAPSSTEILAYDEADTHLDYTAQRLLFEILERQAALPHIQVLAATHSKNFIDMAPLQSILHFRLTGLRTDVEMLASTDHEEELAFQASVCAGLGLRNSMLLDERCFLVIEGDTEEGAIPLLFPLVTSRSLVASGIHVVNTRGSGASRSIVTMLKQRWHRDVVLLLDADARSSCQKWLAELGLAEGHGAYFIGTKEFEDAFDTSVWLNGLEQHFAPAPGELPWRLAELQQLGGATKFSEALHSEVCRRCKNHEIRKPDLGRALAGACSSISDIPSVLQECFQFAARLARYPA